MHPDQMREFFLSYICEFVLKAIVWVWPWLTAVVQFPHIVLMCERRKGEGVYHYWLTGWLPLVLLSWCCVALWSSDCFETHTVLLDFFVLILSYILFQVTTKDQSSDFVWTFIAKNHHFLYFQHYYTFFSLPFYCSGSVWGFVLC